MADRPPKILICSCEDTMPLDKAAVERGCRGADVSTARQLCRAELEKFRAAAAGGEPLIVGCTQEAPLFSETAGDADVTYANLRETAGWSKDADAAGPKMAALLAAAAEPLPEVPFVSLNSDGVILIYGRDEQAIEAGKLLKDHLDVTVLIKPPADVAPPRVTEFPVVQGAIRSAKGYLGTFELIVDGYAQPAPSSRGTLSFAAPRDGAVSRCDLVLDISGDTPLFSAADLRDGYLRADPKEPAAVLKAVLKARDLVGSFDKPRALLTAYREAGGGEPVVLVHDEAHGTPLIEALARVGDGLPADVLPFSVNEVTQIGLEAIAAAFAYDAAAVRLLLRAKPRHDVTGLTRTLALAEPILAGLGFGSARVATIETDDPDALADALRAIEKRKGTPRPATFLPVGGKRDLMRLALRELQRAAPAPVDLIALPAGAPFGAIEINVEGCTLCLACVSACPTGALSDNPERPMLRFAEDACVQCGLCKATCPEKVITLTPQLDFRAATAIARVLKEAEPFHCIRCNKPFGVKSTIERVAAKLEGKHWMFRDSAQRLDLIKMCEDCRVVAITEQEFDPYGESPRPKPRTTEDYLREREEPTRARKPERPA